MRTFQAQKKMDDSMVEFFFTKYDSTFIKLFWEIMSRVLSYKIKRFVQCVKCQEYHSWQQHKGIYAKEDHAEFILRDGC